MRSQAFVIEAEAEEGIRKAQAWVAKELGISGESNPDINVLRYGLFSVADARRVSELAAGVAFSGEHKVVIIAASRAYNQAQNALIKSSKSRLLERIFSSYCRRSAACSRHSATAFKY